jgi:phosphoribosyl 1,2-cyclic phosphodiesterase
MQSELKFYELSSGDKITVDDLVVEAVLLNAASHSVGYRVTWNGHSAVYAIAHSQSPDQLDHNLLHLARQADLLILDAPCNIHANDALKPSPLDWQDQFWQTGLATAKAAGVKRIVMSHYHPDHDDEFLDWMESQVKSVFPNDVLAREGMIIPVC